MPKALVGEFTACGHRDTATRRLGSVERSGYIPLVSPNHPLLRVVAGVRVFHGSGILPVGRVAVQRARSKLNAFQP